MDIPTLTEECDKDGDPIAGVQYSLIDKGKNRIYGDQHWTASGGDSLPVQRRTVTVTYGPWVDDDPRVRRLEELIRSVPVPAPWVLSRAGDFAAGANEMRKAILAVLAAERTPNSHDR